MRIDELVQEYVATRNLLSEKRKEFEDFEKKSKNHLSELESAIMQLFEELGVTNTKTDFGTAYKTTKRHVRMANWDKFISFIKRTDNYQLLEKRPAKLASLEVLENDDSITPDDIGLDVVSEVVVQVTSK